MSITTTYILYLTVMIVSTAFIWAAELFAKKKRKLVIDIADHRYCLENQNKYNCVSWLFVLCSFLVAILPLALRNCGADTKQYYHNYIYGSKTGEDIIFYGIFDVLHGLFSNPKMGLAIVGGIALAVSYVAFLLLKSKINIVYCFFAYYMYLYLFMYNYVRMMFAASIIFLGYAFIIRNQKAPALICFFIASGCHKSAILVLLIAVYLFFYYRFKKLMTSLAVVLLGVFILNPTYFIFKIDDERYSSHINATYVQHTSIGIGTLIKILPFAVILIWKYRKLKNDPLYYTFMIMIVANFLFSVLGYFVPVASRLSNMYFVFHALFMVPWLIEKVNIQGNRIAMKTGFVVFCVFIFYLGSQVYVGMDVIPYY